MEIGNESLRRSVIGDPLVSARQKYGNFEISLAMSDHISVAAAHRPLIHEIRVENTGWVGDSEEIIVSIHGEIPGSQSVLRPFMKAYRAPGVGDVILDGFPKVSLNLNTMCALDEAVRGDIVVRVLVDDETLAEQRFPLDVLAYNQWLHSRIDFDCLSAFVFPSHPVVSQIMHGVRDRLLRASGNGSTAGYQMGTERVLHMTQAIFEELQSLGIEYSDPPASFEGYGQKIRTPDVIMRERVATCLDSTVLAASCIAAAGLSPLIFIVSGHAFPAVWVSERNAISAQGPFHDPFRPSVIDNPNDLQLMHSMSMIASFESTMICRSLAQPFSEAFHRHADFSEGRGVETFLAFVDVERSAEAGVRRLPNRTLSANGDSYEVEIDRTGIEVERPDGHDIASSNSDDSDRERLSDGDVPRRVRRWMDALLNIENSNPLVNLNSEVAFLPMKSKRGPRSIEIPTVPGSLAAIEDRLMSGTGLKAVCAHRLPVNLLNNLGDQALLEHLQANGELPIARPIDLLGVIDHEAARWAEEGLPPQRARGQATHAVESAHEKEVARRFKALKKEADETEAESATNQLFLTIGSLVWESPGEGTRAAKVVRSPMFIIPVRVTGTAQSSFRIVMDEGGEISPNYCLVEKLRSELGLVLRELESPNLDDHGIDVDNTIATIRRQLGSSKFATIRVEEDCSLAVLDFATFRMWKDIRVNWRLFTKNPVVDHLINGSSDSFHQETAPFTGEPLTPFDCDESQLEAVKWALEGRSFVLEGPPGTGKSQTIANLIAAGMAEGRRILFVAEKQVALEAVSRKLEEIGLDPFCITMHHESTTPESIRSQLQTALDFVGQDVSNQWASESAVVASLQERLNHYRASLIETNVLGASALSASREVVRLGDGPAVPVGLGTLDAVASNREALRSSLLELRSVAGASRVQPTREWTLSTLSNVETLPKDELHGALERLADAVEAHGDLRPLLEPLLDSTGQLGVPAAIDQVVALVMNAEVLEPSVARAVLLPAWANDVASIRSSADAVRSGHQAVFDFFRDEALSMDLTPQTAAATEAINAGLLSRKKKAETLRGLIAPIAKVAVTQDPAELLTLLQRVSPAREAVAGVAHRARAVPHLQIRHDFDPLSADHLDEIDRQVEDLRERAEISLLPEVDVVKRLVQSGVTFSGSTSSEIAAVLEAWSTVRARLEVSEESHSAWLAGRSVWSAITESLPAWVADSPAFGSLTRHTRVLQTLEPLRLAGQTELVSSILAGETALDDIYSEFERGLARASLQERLLQGALSGFEQSTFDKAVAEFNRRDRGRRQLMRTLIPRQLSESRPFRPGVRTGAIGELERELGRKVRRVSMPKLIQRHGEMITRLAPCFLMSPEAVSRLLPADSQFFDLVVFDEASQIRVAAAIPAMGRARSVIVVGDSQQMPPSKRVGQRQATGENDEAFEEDVLQDLESILAECSESNLPSLMLQCHFRSQHEGLIAFSNRNFYDGRLVTFPAPNSDRTTPVSWIDVPDGQFIRKGEARGTNPEEAKAVAAEIQRRLNSPEHASKSIGVVTFNEPQAAHVLELLEEIASNDRAVMRALSNPRKSDRLFVVPLEKVQGDERDTIMLSVSYSYQDGARNKVSPTWGPLTNKGGERRLNVAITRAKKDLVVFCSFDPNHVDVRNSTYLGVPATVEFLKECRDAALSAGAALKARDATAVDRYRRDLAERLRSAGVRVRENVGLSRFRIDLAVSDEAGDQQFLALLLDGDEWASRGTAYDREVLPNSVLRLIGWRRIGRLWLKASIDDPDLVVSTVKNELAREHHRVELMGLLRGRGFEVRDDSALSRDGVDMAVRLPGQTMWPLAIALNGPGLFAQYLPFEGEVPRDEHLRTLGCVEALSVWLPDLLSDPESLLDRVTAAVDRASEYVDVEPVAGEPDELSGVRDESAVVQKGSSGPAGDGALLAQSERWSEFVDARTLPELGDTAALGPGPGYAPDLVRRAIDEVVDLEGPIQEKRLASVVVGRFGMTKVKAARLDALTSLFTHLPRTTNEFGTVYWSRSRPVNEWTGFRTSLGEVTRSIDEVPAEELMNAMVEVVRMGGSATSEEIIRLVAQAFGRKSVTAQLRSHLSAVLAWSVALNKVIVEDDLYTIPG